MIVNKGTLGAFVLGVVNELGHINHESCKVIALIVEEFRVLIVCVRFLTEVCLNRAEPSPGAQGLEGVSSVESGSAPYLKSVAVCDTDTHLPISDGKERIILHFLVIIDIL